MRDFIKKVLQEEFETKGIVSEMAKKTYCERLFNSLSPELPFCNAAEDYIKNEIEQVGRKKTKVIFDKFRSGIAQFYENIQDEILEIKIEELNELSKIVSDGKKELKDAEEKLKDNCSKVDSVARKQLESLKTKTQLYFTGKEGDYNLTNRLDTNYSAIAILFTKFFSKKGAFDGIKYGENIDWGRVAKNWIEHSFNPSIKFMDVRPEEEKQDTTAALSSLEFKELAKIYFSNSIAYGSAEIRKAVEDVLQDVRQRGFESEHSFEKKYLTGKKEYINYAKDYGFVDRYLGIDFIYKGRDYWIPVQVKSSPKEATYLISTLGCKTYVIAEKTGNTFKLSKVQTDKLSD